jgi:hypothetical protein
MFARSQEYQKTRLKTELHSVAAWLGSTVGKMKIGPVLRRSLASCVVPGDAARSKHAYISLISSQPGHARFKSTTNLAQSFI